MQKKDCPHLSLAHKYWKELLREGDLAIDATCGNGHDTLFLSGLCEVVALDIQKQALENTEKLLKSHGKKVTLHLLCHSQIDTLPSSPKLIVYNLGYLPGADKTLTTKKETTLQSLQTSSQILKTGGALSIMCYPGHEEGAKEEQVVLEWAQTLSANDWRVCHHRWINKEKAPSFLWIEKRRNES